MKDPADDRSGELDFAERVRRFIERGTVTQRVIDAQLVASPLPPKPKRGVSKNASKSADKPERRQ